MRAAPRHWPRPGVNSRSARPWGVLRMRALASLVLVLGFLHEHAAQAAEPTPFDGPGLELGPQAGAYHFTPSWPAGYGAQAAPWGWFIGGEVVWRLNANLGIGGTITYATASGAALPFYGIGYTFTEVLASFEVSWRFVPHPAVRPWIGLGMGVGSFKYVETGDNAGDISYFEFEYFRVRGGVDFTQGRVALGVWVGWGLGTSDSIITRPAMSLQIGVRLLFDLGSRGPLL
jgi:hypothetical protein